MQWGEFEQRQPKLAAVGATRLIEPGVILVVTIRADGSPRLSPVEPLIVDGALFLSMLWNSRKAADLLRDPRILAHSIVAGRDGGDGEFKVRGTARVEADSQAQARFAATAAATVGWEPTPGRFHLFSVDIDDVVFIRYDEPTGDQFLSAWPPGREFVRRGTSATSLGRPEARRDLLVPD